MTANDGLDAVISDSALNATHLQVVNACGQEVLIALDCDTQCTVVIDFGATFLTGFAGSFVGVVIAERSLSVEGYTVESR